MARRGRPRSSGKRSKTGRLLEQFIKGNPVAEERKAAFGTNGWDAIGRAYAVGLLGEGNEAKARLDAARAYASAYHAVWGRPYRCALDTSPRGGTDGETPEAIERMIARRLWVNERTRAINATACGSYFDQLVDPLRHATDHDCYWLADLIDSALANRKRALTGQRAEPAYGPHLMLLAAALRGLDALVAFRGGERTVIQRRAA